MSPDRRRHRGAHPEDARLFDESWLAALRTATSELSWLLTRGYQPKSALKLVGDRHNLRERQRLAVARAACSDEGRGRRLKSRVEADTVKGASLVVDGFNLVITLEAALSGGVLVRGRDGCVRDLSSVHGSYRAVEETDRAVTLAGETLAALGPASVLWLFDSPVSNSGRLAARVRELAAERGWPWSVETQFNPDRSIVNSDAVAVTSDSNVLDGVARWLNLSRLVVEHHVHDSWLIDLGED
ncbi:MAG TPA: DUF434 domain-containing protein [Pyrinomonadaceae bacterium]|nr:DUF434 domain-containing protein [Pyrinomonadaceae bacterium]